MCVRECVCGMTVCMCVGVCVFSWVTVYLVCKWGWGGVVVLYMPIRVCVCVYVCVREPVSNPLNHCRVSSMYACVCAMSPGRLVLACSTTVWIRGEAFGVALCFNLELMTEPPALLAILPLLPNTYSVYLLAPPCTPPFTCSANPHNLTQNAHCLPSTRLPHSACFIPFFAPSVPLLFHLLSTSCHRVHDTSACISDCLIALSKQRLGGSAGPSETQTRVWGRLNTMWARCSFKELFRPRNNLRPYSCWCSFLSLEFVCSHARKPVPPEIAWAKA